MRASRGLKWENKMYKPKRSILVKLEYNNIVKIFKLHIDAVQTEIVLYIHILS